MLIYLRSSSRSAQEGSFSRKKVKKNKRGPAMSEMLLQKPSGCSSPPCTSAAACPVLAPAGRSQEQQRVQQHQAAPHQHAEPQLPGRRRLGHSPRARSRGRLAASLPPPFLGTGGNYRFSRAKHSLIAARAGGIDFLFCFKCS